MDTLRQYVISVVTAVILGSVMTGLLNHGLMHDLVKLICGALLTVTLIGPLSNKIPFDFQYFGQSYGQDAQTAAEAGERYSANTYTAIIKRNTEAYILDKASDLNLTLAAEAVLSQESPPVPVSVYLQGTVPPLARQKLSEVIEQDLGIAKEKLQWIG